MFLCSMNGTLGYMIRKRKTVRTPVLIDFNERIDAMYNGFLGGFKHGTLPDALEMIKKVMFQKKTKKIIPSSG